MEHSDAGRIILPNKDSGLVTTFAIDAPYREKYVTPLVLSVTASQQTLKAIRSKIMDGETLDIEYGFKHGKFGDAVYEVVAWTKINRLNQAHAIFAHTALRGEILTNEKKEEYLYVLGSGKDDVLPRIAPFLPTPLYPAWYEHIWNEASSEHLVTLMECKGISVWKVKMKGWQEIISRSLKGGKVNFDGV